MEYQRNAPTLAQTIRFLLNSEESQTINYLLKMEGSDIINILNHIRNKTKLREILTSVLNAKGFPSANTSGECAPSVT